MIGEVVLPGDIIQDLTTHNGAVILGPGLRRQLEEEQIVITRPGVLNFKSPNVYWIEGHLKRYVPRKGEIVVGVVQAKRGDILKIDIGASETASLSTFAFEGATKKQKPDLQLGDAVYARLLSAHREMEPELVCIDSYFKAGKLGVLANEGFIFNITTEYAHNLLNYDNPMLKTLGKKTPYELAVGMNGKIWIKAKSTQDIFTIFSAIMSAENKTLSDINKICRKH